VGVAVVVRRDVVTLAHHHRPGGHRVAVLRELGHAGVVGEGGDRAAHGVDDAAHQRAKARLGPAAEIGRRVPRADVGALPARQALLLGEQPTRDLVIDRRQARQVITTGVANNEAASEGPVMARSSLDHRRAASRTAA